MEKYEKKELDNSFALSQPSPSGLKGRQSVRTTFKLSQKTIEIVSIIAAHLGIKQKSLFDHLIEDVESLCSIASEIQRLEPKKQNRIQKTYVISRKSLYSLEKVSNDYDASRDALIEYSVQRLLPLIDREREKHIKRKEILQELIQYVKLGQSMLGRARELLGEDDPVYEKLELAISVCENAHVKIKTFIEKGNKIEGFE